MAAALGHGWLEAEAKRGVAVGSVGTARTPRQAGRPQKRGAEGLHGGRWAAEPCAGLG